MPEGHTLHRYARLQSKALVGKPLEVSSPQGRFAQGAARLDGGVIEKIEAYGKHLLYRWASGDVLHVHLGLYGRFRSGDQPPFENTRLLMISDNDSLQLSGPSTCEVLDPEGEAALLSRLGPDPLRAENGVRRKLVASFARRSTPVGGLLLDQKVIAGIGNVYRAELLFRAGINPFMPACDLGEDEVLALWQDTRQQLRLGERSGRIVTVEPEEMGASSRRELSDEERLYVYHREGLGCRRCGTAIVRNQIAQRAIWFCPKCQHR